MKKAFLYETLDFLLNCDIIIDEKGVCDKRFTSEYSVNK